MARGRLALRALMVALLAGLASCGGTPADYGITGPGVRSVAPKSRDVLNPAHDLSIPNSTPDTGNGRYWGYN